VLDVAQAWGYVHEDDIADAQRTAGQVHALTAP
jgi:hypothetical protein